MPDRNYLYTLVYLFQLSRCAWMFRFISNGLEKPSINKTNWRRKRHETIFIIESSCYLWLLRKGCLCQDVQVRKFSMLGSVAIFRVFLFLSTFVYPQKFSFSQLDPSSACPLVCHCTRKTWCQPSIDYAKRIKAEIIWFVSIFTCFSSKSLNLYRIYMQVFLNRSLTHVVIPVLNTTFLFYFVDIYWKVPCQIDGNEYACSGGFGRTSRGPG